MNSSNFTSEEREQLASIGSRVKSLRKRQGMTQSEVANECGLNKQYISDVEHGKRNPALLTLIKIANAMNVSLAEIFS